MTAPHAGAAVKYAAPLQFIHWLVALLVAGQLTLALVLPRLLSLEYGQLVLALHRQVGIAILLCMLIRLGLVLRYRAPSPSSALPTWQKFAMTGVHRVLYALLLLQPLLGIGISWARGNTVSVFGLITLPAPFDISDMARERITQAHTVLAVLLLTLIVFHLGAITFNRWVRRLSVMDRILPSAPAHSFVNRIPIAIQLLLGFGLVVCVALATGIYSVSTYRDFSRLTTTFQDEEFAAAADTQTAQLAWKEFVGLATAPRSIDNDTRLRGLAESARSSLRSAAAHTSAGDVRNELVNLAGLVSAAADPGVVKTSTAREVDAQLQDLADAQRAAAFQSRTNNAERIARGQDLIVMAIAPMALLGIVLALILARSISGAVDRMRALVSGIEAGDSHAGIRVIGRGGFAALMRDMVSMRATVALRSAAAAEHSHELLRRLQKITSQVPGIVYQYRLRPDGTSHFPYASEGIRQIYGVTPESVSEDAGAMFAALHPDDRVRVREGIAASAAHSTPWHDEYRVCLPGRESWVSGNAQPEREADGSVLWHGFAADVTERWLAEQEIASARIRLQGVLDAATETSIIATDLRGVITMFSAGAARMLGYTSNEMVGQHDLLFIHLKDELADRSRQLTDQFNAPIEGFDIIVHALRNGRRDTRDWTYIRKNGSTLPVTIDLTAVCDTGGCITGFLAVATDITTQRQGHEALQAAKEAAESASRAKSDFLANMSHEIRTPLNGVIGMTGLLLDTPLREDQREFAEIARSSGESLLAVLNDVLDFSKIEAGQMALEKIDFDFLTIIEQSVDAIALRAGEKGLELVIDVDPTLPRGMRGDPTRLRQIVLNLLSNAVKFTEKGDVRLLARRQQAADGRVRMRVEVIDTGVGLTDEQRSRLFMPFIQADTSMTRRFGGTGLGLSICRRLIELMNGSIGVDSTPGSGSCFWFEIALPIVALSALPIETVDLEGCEVLVIDDHPVNLRIINGQLASFGCRVTSAATAASGEDAWRQLVAADRAPDVVLLDHDLPDHPGPWLAERLRRNPAGAHVPIVLMTSLGSRVRHPTQEGSIDRIMTKPVKQTALLQCLQEVVGMARATTVLTPVAQGEDLQGLQVLLVEDNAVNQKLMCRILEKLGVDVTVADNGEAAIAKLTATRFEVVLMDCQMPVLDGYEATRRIRAGAAGPSAKTIPIIALTAHALSGDRERCVTAGMNDYLTKPIDAGKLKILLRGARGAGSSRVKPSGVVGVAMDATAVFDEAALHQRVGDDSAFLGELLSAFVGTIDEHVVALLAAATRGDASAIVMHAHVIQGTAANVSAGVLAEAAAALERTAKEGLITPEEVEAVRLAWRDTKHHPALEPIVAKEPRTG
jgi:PAS domain S-box-containing protein